jgi:hypothetical protein
VSLQKEVSGGVGCRQRVVVLCTFGSQDSACLLSEVVRVWDVALGPRLTDDMPPCGHDSKQNDELKNSLVH